ncbi:A/G-specific adenine glycosylase [Streptococcus sp. NLN76]|uniref:A/G-specific adenine glycosylase n=1 Tax=Streptococcus sp. NLN76 TaxID=2822800 RepID=UPI0018AB3BEE|nr:A/G-specific adenine glycosylase [Streptococcus sp. NLN76]MBF8969716.1 A/G-specific adenine glycosylase [Streptococcus sp. NLN76]
MINFEKYGIEMWPEEKIQAFRLALLTWYDQEKRDLPWRENTDPYRIWVSEIMLQQTRVDTVIPYFHRFLKTFPTIQDLAAAEEELLLKTWEGLGYYSRVRNMQIAAQTMVEDYHGKFPETIEEIRKLKGIGPYTAGAIASIAFNLPEPAVDGNVMRVLARLFEVDLDIGNPSNRKVFQAMMDVLIDPKRPGDFNQALMDLGSDIEAPVNPRPEDSPVKVFSAAYKHGTMDKYPIKAPKKKPISIYLKAFVLQNQEGKFLLEKNDHSKLLAGFWHFPLLEVEEEQELNLFNPVSEGNDVLDARTRLEADYPFDIEWEEITLPQVKHVFSHRKWHVDIQLGHVQGNPDVPVGSLWVSAEDFSSYPFARPQQKIWEIVESNLKAT